MSFSEVLRGLTDSVKGAKGAFIVGMDGIIVDEYKIGPEAVDYNSVGAEYGNVLKEIQNASRALHLGDATEVAVMTDEVDIIMRKINDEYFIALLLSHGTNVGKGRFLARATSRKLEKEF